MACLPACARSVYTTIWTVILFPLHILLPFYHLCYIVGRLWAVVPLGNLYHCTTYKHLLWGCNSGEGGYSQHATILQQALQTSVPPPGPSPLFLHFTIPNIQWAILLGIPHAMPENCTCGSYGDDVGDLAGGRRCHSTDGVVAVFRVKGCHMSATVHFPFAAAPYMTYTIAMHFPPTCHHLPTPLFVYLFCAASTSF